MFVLKSRFNSKAAEVARLTAQLQELQRVNQRQEDVINKLKAYIDRTDRGRAAAAAEFYKQVANLNKLQGK